MNANELLRELLEVCIDHRYSLPSNLRIEIDAFLAAPAMSAEEDAARYRSVREKDWEIYVVSRSWYPQSDSERRAWVASYDAAIDSARKKEQ